MMDNLILNDNGGFTWAYPKKGGYGKPKCAFVIQSRAPCGSAPLTGTLQHDAKIDSEQQWGIYLGLTLGGRGGQAKMLLCYSMQGSLWKCCADGNRRA